MYVVMAKKAFSAISPCFPETERSCQRSSVRPGIAADDVPQYSSVVALNPPRRTSCSRTATETRNISRKGAKHVLSDVEGTPMKQNPKSEYRNPKQTQRLKSQLRNPKRDCLELSDFRSLDTVSNFGFRISSLFFLACFAPWRESIALFENSRFVMSINKCLHLYTG